MEKRAVREKRRALLSRFYQGNRLCFCVALACAVLMAAINLALSFLMQQLVDAISGEADVLPLPALAWMTAGLAATVIAVEGINCVAKPAFLRRAMRQYKEEAFAQLLQKNLSTFREEATATYISALSNDTASLETNYLEKQFSIAVNAVVFAGAFAMMLLYSPLLTAVAVGLSVLPLLASVLVGDRLKTAERQVSDRNESLLATLKDSLNGFSVIKSFQAEREILRAFSQMNRETEDVKCKKRRLADILGTIGAVAGMAAQMGVFLAGAAFALSGKGITPGVVMVFVQLMNFVIQPIAEIPRDVAGRRAALSLVDKLAAALETHVRDQGAQLPPVLHRELALEGLTFRYGAGRAALSDVSAVLQAGRCYAVVGASGSGKSTLLGLCIGMDDRYEGRILLDGHDVRDISCESLYGLVSIIQQEVFVFNASIRENITMFRPFPPEAVEEAIRGAGLSALVENRGDAYLCGENGCNLSGGERQRIAIARCLLRRTPVLLVDEATASLDRQTARHIVNTLLNLTGILRVVVTHVLDAEELRRFDGILALKNGRVEECGTFEELMRQRGYFYSLYTVSQ